MQMNYYNLSELMFILHSAGVMRVHTELTNHGGPIGAFSSSRFRPDQRVRSNT